MGRSFFGVALSLLAIAQVAFSLAVRDRKPHWDILPPVPTEQAVSAAAFGDRQFLYRALTLSLQNFGDTGGRVTALRDYDMTAVVGWLSALDSLDHRANHHVRLAMLYFAQTQDRPKLRYLIAWIRGHVVRAPAEKYWWLTNAIMLAERRLSDLPLALEIAEQMAAFDLPGMRIEALEYPAFLKEKMGDYAGAAEVVERVLAVHGATMADDALAWSKSYASEMRTLARDPSLRRKPPANVEEVP